MLIQQSAKIRATDRSQVVSGNDCVMSAKGKNLKRLFGLAGVAQGGIYRKSKPTPDCYDQYTKGNLVTGPVNMS